MLGGCVGVDTDKTVIFNGQSGNLVVVKETGRTQHREITSHFQVATLGVVLDEQIGGDANTAVDIQKLRRIVRTYTHVPTVFDNHHNVSVVYKACDVGVSKLNNLESRPCTVVGYRESFGNFDVRVDRVHLALYREIASDNDVTTCKCIRNVDVLSIYVLQIVTERRQSHITLVEIQPRGDVIVETT